MTDQREFWTESWAEFEPRIAKLHPWPADLEALWARMPPIPLSYSPSGRGLIALNLCLFSLNGCLVPMHHALLATSSLWQAGYLSMIALPARFALEAGGGVAYANWVWAQFEKTGDDLKATERVARLTMGARSPVELPWGEPATRTSINVMDFIDRLPGIGYDTARADYEFLCESAHPSFLQHTFWNMVSAPASDFRSPLLDQRITRDLERVVGVLESVCQTVGSTSTSLLQALLPVVEADAGASG